MSDAAIIAVWTGLWAAVLVVQWRLDVRRFNRECAERLEEYRARYRWMRHEQ